MGSVTVFASGVEVNGRIEKREYEMMEKPQLRH